MPETQQNLKESISTLKETVDAQTAQIGELSQQVNDYVSSEIVHGQPFLITGITVFILACFVGYHVVWRVTPALHSPLMGITNAISSVIIVGAVMAVWPDTGDGNGGFSLMGFLAVIFASINIFGGFIITRRMLSMFKKKGA